MKKSNKTLKILVGILATLFALQILQYQFGFIKIRPLDGYYIAAEKQEASWKGWFSGEYQEKTDQYLNEFFGFRSFFIRVNHQICYTFFNKAKTGFVKVGKENYLYDESYIKAYYGDNYIGRDSIAQRMYMLKSVQDTLSKMGKSIVWVLAAGKGSFYPEYIPDSYHKKRDTTNTETYLHYAKELGINHIDFSTYFQSIKETSPYPLYPQFGIHWSYYSTCLAADSITCYLEQLRNIEMQHLYWEKIEVKRPNKMDRDISESMNLLFPPKSFDMGYPVVQYGTDEGKTKPSLIAITDSFYWSIYSLGWGNLFTNNQFWYYYREIRKADSPDLLTVEQINLSEEIMNNDIFIILGTDANLPNLGWGFIEDAYKVLFQGE